MHATNTFTIKEIDAQIQRIASSSSFKNSPVLIRFLEFVVSETHQERESSLKEYTIALNVLKRSPDFNPQDDAVVRIHAGRLRRALNDYYFTEGVNDPIVVHIPKGGYVPQFEVKELSQRPVSKVLPDRGMNPVVAIFPFKAISASPEYMDFAWVLGEQLGAELSRFPDVSVIGYYSAEMASKIDQNMLDAGKSLGADYVITGSLRCSGDRLRISVHLLITATGEVLMAKSFEGTCDSQNVFNLQDEIVENVIGAVGGYYGLVFQEMVKAAPAKLVQHAEIRAGIYRYYNYQRSFSLANYNEAVSALQLTIKEYPGHAVSWAMLGELYLNGLWIKNVKTDDPLELGYQCVLQALKIDPQCQYAWHSLTLVHLLKGEKESVLQSARKCVQLNPNCPALISGVSFMLICAGYFEEGFQMMNKGVELSPYCPWWINGGFSLYYLYKNQYAEALLWADKMNSEGTFWGNVLKAAALSYLGRKEEADKSIAKLVEMGLATTQQLEKRLSSFLLSEELIGQIVNGVEKRNLNTRGTDIKRVLA